MRLGVWVLAFVVTGCGPTVPLAPTEAVEKVSVLAMPSDVVAFIEAREVCEHFMGEFVGDPAIDGPRGINQQIEAACVGLDERLAALKLKYFNDAATMAVLSGYEPLY